MAIGLQARRWRFDYPAEADEIEHDAVRAAARFFRERKDLLPEGVAPPNATERAVLAVRLHDAFHGHDDETGRPVAVDPDADAIRSALSSSES